MKKNIFFIMTSLLSCAVLHVAAMEDKQSEQSQLDLSSGFILPSFAHKSVKLLQKNLTDANQLTGKGEITATGWRQRIAVLDTNVDYTHSALGGSGLLSDYQAAVAATNTLPNWPQGNIIDGWDFIHHSPNPIALQDSHGTQLSHSIVAIAPEAELIIYGICQKGDCSSAAAFKAFQAVIESQDGHNNGVDIVNLSLGSELGYMANVAARVDINKMLNANINVVGAAGNYGPSPFGVDGPSTVLSAFSVGAVTSPNTKVSQIHATFDGKSIRARDTRLSLAHQYEFSATSTPLIYPSSNQNGCGDFEQDLTGKAVMVEFGECRLPLKVVNAQKKGAAFVVLLGDEYAIYNSDTESTNHDGELLIPSISVASSVVDWLKSAVKSRDVAYHITASEVSGANAIAPFSARGPSYAGHLKPEIVAPGDGVFTALAGSGDKLAPVSGTEFASAMVSGAVALAREALPDRSALEIKATLMNSANLDITMEPRAVDPDAALAPISAIGAGLVDIEKALNLPVIAWDKETQQAALSYGLVTLDKSRVIKKTIEIKNFSAQKKTYHLKVIPRDQAKYQTGALHFSLPRKVSVAPGKTAQFEVAVTVDPTKLPPWSLTSTYELNHSANEAAAALTAVEYDGAIVFFEGKEPALHVVYHMLPKAVSTLSVGDNPVDDGLLLPVTNTGSTTITRPFVTPLIARSAENSQLHFGSSVLGIAKQQCQQGIMLYHTLQMHEAILHPFMTEYSVDYALDDSELWTHTVSSINIQTGDQTYPKAMYSSVTNNASSESQLRPAVHVTGNQFVTMTTCFEDLGLTTADLGKVITLRYRTKELGTNIEESMTAQFVLNLPNLPTKLIDASGNSVTELKPKETAFIINYLDKYEQGFLLLSDMTSTAVHPVTH